MNGEKSDSTLYDALDQFEASINIPVVAGELPSWVEEVRDSWRDASGQIELQAMLRHRRQIAQIADEDPGLMSRIEEMRAENAAIETARQSLSTIVDWLAEHVSDFEPDESKLKQHIALLTRDGIALINRVKKQEVTVRTWFFEAFNRDRGIAD